MWSCSLGSSVPAQPLAQQPLWCGEAALSWPLGGGKEPGGSQVWTGSSPWAPASWGCFPMLGWWRGALRNMLQPSPPGVLGSALWAWEMLPARPHSSSPALPLGTVFTLPGSLKPPLLSSGLPVRAPSQGPDPQPLHPLCLGAGGIVPGGQLLGWLRCGGAGAD